MQPSIVLGGGCFWCLDAAYRQVKGVVDVVSGYAGGTRADPAYELVVGGGTGHAEVVQVFFDESIVPESIILEMFWALHDPTTLNRQGADVGDQYRSVILYGNQDQKQRAEASLLQAQKHWDNPIVTKIEPLQQFYPAETYHQDYFAHHPEQAYCQVVINPKLIKLRQHFAPYLV